MVAKLIRVIHSIDSLCVSKEKTHKVECAEFSIRALGNRGPFVQEVEITKRCLDRWDWRGLLRGSLSDRQSLYKLCLLQSHPSSRGPRVEKHILWTAI